MLRWIRDILGIRKDLVDLKKVEHEERLDDAGIQVANLDQVREFDPKQQEIEARLRTSDRSYPEAPETKLRSRAIPLIVVLLVIAYVVVKFLYDWWTG